MRENRETHDGAYTKSTILCVCVFAPHVAFDHEIHVATSHAWVSSRFRRVLVCMTPRYVVSHTLLSLGVAVARVRACVSTHADIPFKSPHRNSGGPANV